MPEENRNDKEKSAVAHKSLKEHAGLRRWVDSIPPLLLPRPVPPLPRHVVPRRRRPHESADPPQRPRVKGSQILRSRNSIISIYTGFGNIKHPQEKLHPPRSETRQRPHRRPGTHQIIRFRAVQIDLDRGRWLRQLGSIRLRPWQNSKRHPFFLQEVSAEIPIQQKQKTCLQRSGHTRLHRPRDAQESRIHLAGRLVGFGRHYIRDAGGLCSLQRWLQRLDILQNIAFQWVPLLPPINKNIIRSDRSHQPASGRPQPPSRSQRFRIDKKSSLVQWY